MQLPGDSIYAASRRLLPMLGWDLSKTQLFWAHPLPVRNPSRMLLEVSLYTLCLPKMELDGVVT